MYKAVFILENRIILDNIPLKDFSVASDSALLTIVRVYKLYLLTYLYYIIRNLQIA